MISKIVQLYLTELPKCPVMLDETEAKKYFTRLLMNGNIITYVKDGELLGFVEFWRINNEQFGRLCRNHTLSHDEDLLSGDLCLITRMYIVPDLRNAETFLFLGRALLERNKDAVDYAAMQMHKKHKPLQCYSREQILKHYRMEK